MIVKYSRSSILAHVTRPLLGLFHAVNTEQKGNAKVHVHLSCPPLCDADWSTTSILLEHNFPSPPLSPHGGFVRERVLKHPTISLAGIHCLRLHRPNVSLPRPQPHTGQGCEGCQDSVCGIPAALPIPVPRIQGQESDGVLCPYGVLAILVRP